MVGIDQLNEVVGDLEKLIIRLNEKVDRMENRLDAHSSFIENQESRIDFLKETVKQLCIEGIKSNIEKLDLENEDAVVFNVPDELNYDASFFDSILPIFQEKNVTVIVLHQGITIDILRKQDGEEELQPRPQD